MNETDAGITSYDDADADCKACRLGVGITVRGMHSLLLSAGNAAGGDGVAELRAAQDAAFLPPLVAFAPAAPAAAQAAKAAKADGKKAHKGGGVSAVTEVAALPANVKLMTLQAVNPTALFLRLEHGFALGEDGGAGRAWSADAEVNVTAFCESMGFAVAGWADLTLTGNQALVELAYLPWPTATGAADAAASAERRRRRHHHRGNGAHRGNRGALAAAAAGGEDGDVMTLSAMEVRSVIVYLDEPLSAALTKRRRGGA